MTANYQTDMPPQVTPSQQQRPQQRGRDTAIAGAALIALGALMLVATLSNLAVAGTLVLAAGGVIFIAWAISIRNAGLFIPGGILTGLGVSTFITEQFQNDLSSEATGGIITLGLGLGFLLIIPLSMYFTSARNIWAIFPGGILTIIGILLIAGATGMLELLGRLWPVAVIAVGAYLLYRWYVSERKPRQPEHPT